MKPASAAAALAAAALAASAGCGARHEHAAASPEAPTPAQAHRLLVARLHAKQLDFTRVSCVRNGRTYKGTAIVRCNVDFGIDPHVEAYCAVLDEGRLVTNHENPAIPCTHDDAGYSAPIKTS